MADKLPEFVASCCGHSSADCHGCPEWTILMLKSEYENDMIDGRKIGEKIGIKWEDSPFTLKQFQKGIDAESEEHGTDEETKVIDTATEAGKVAWAHLKEDPKYYDKLEDCVESIATKEDLQNLLEATPESARDRLRRRSSHQQDTTRSHQDTETGHSKLKPPEFNKRVKPKRERADRTQMQHAGKMGHRHSARKQLGEPKRFTEAINFLHENIGKPFGDGLLSEIEDKQALHIVATKLMGHAGINRDWLSDLCNILDNE